MDTVNTNLERQLTIVHKIVEYVEMAIVIILKIVKPVLMIVGHVRSQTLVGMGIVI